MPKISVDTFYPDKEEVLDPETDLPGDADLGPEVETLFSCKQQNINSNNCARILEELKKKYSIAESGN